MLQTLGGLFLWIEREYKWLSKMDSWQTSEAELPAPPEATPQGALSRSTCWVAVLGWAFRGAEWGGGDVHTVKNVLSGDLRKAPGLQKEMEVLKTFFF